jgi:hypothetical protein
MNFFEQELRKLVGQSDALADPRYIGRACYGGVNGNIRAKLQFVTMGYADRYEALKTTLINNTEGEIDCNIIRLKDVWGAKPVNNPNFPDGVSPHIWKTNGDYDWYAYKPTPRDYEILAGSVDEYLEMFSEDMEYGQTMT